VQETVRSEEKFLRGLLKPPRVKPHFDPKPKGSSPGSDESKAVGSGASAFLMASAQNFFRHQCVPPFIFPGGQTVMKLFVA
jgi:hypothetical protein